MLSEPTRPGSRRRAPQVTPEEAAALCTASFLEPATIVRLDAEWDATFRVEETGGRWLTLKLSSAGWKEGALRLEEAALVHLEALDFPGVPRLVRSRAGRLSERVEHAGAELDVRLFTWVSGVVLAAVHPRTARLLGELGFYLGSLDRALEPLRPDIDRSLDWDLLRLAEERKRIDRLDDRGDRELVERAVDRFLDRHRTLSPRLPRSLVHHDANDHNVVVSSTDGARAHLAGLIDFGDLLVTETVHELAIAAAYAVNDRADPWGAIEPLVVGYDRARRLEEPEVRLLFPAVQARLAHTLLMAAKRRREGSADAYALVSERSARRTLRALSAIDEGEALAHLLERLDRTRPGGTW